MDPIAWGLPLISLVEIFNNEISSKKFLRTREFLFQKIRDFPNALLQVKILKYSLTFINLRIRR